MKVLQLNAWGGRLGEQIHDLINQEKPDVICLQEIISLKGGGNGGFFLTVNEIEQLFDMNLAFSPLFGFPFQRRKAEFGNAILSKQKMVSANSIFTRLEYKDNFDFETDDYNVKNLLHVTVDNGGRQLHILTYHGHHVPGHKKGNEETMRQCLQIAKYIKGLSGKIILTGDFNLEPNSASLEEINALLLNLSAQAKLKTTRTALTHKTEVCDYIFVNQEIEVKQFEALDDIVSDHKALVLEFE